MGGAILRLRTNCLCNGMVVVPAGFISWAWRVIERRQRCRGPYSRGSVRIRLLHGIYSRQGKMVIALLRALAGHAKGFEQMRFLQGLIPEATGRLRLEGGGADNNPMPRGRTKGKDFGAEEHNWPWRVGLADRGEIRRAIPRCLRFALPRV